MLFLPVYYYESDGGFVIGTHVDSAAKASGRERCFDTVSLADFILHHIVTFPFTAYLDIKQLAPASNHVFTASNRNTTDAMHTSEAYWIPREISTFKNIDEAAIALRESLAKYTEEVTSGMNRVAHFISAGEDSRAVAGLLPQSLERHAYITVDSKNREWSIAKKVAEAYGANFHTAFRSPNFYLDILSEAADMIGCGHQYAHAHTLAFTEDQSLAEYNAVFGGFLADRLIKGLYARKARWASRFPFLPEIALSDIARNDKLRAEPFGNKICEQILSRRKDLFTKVKNFRPSSAFEWFTLWTGMAPGAPNVYVNRRKFRSYEPFMSNKVVKISAEVPVTWKLNKRLFNKALQPYLKKSKWILHPKGYYPYFPWYRSVPLIFTLWLMRQMGERMGLIKGNQGPWADWRRLNRSKEWKSTEQRLVSEYSPLFNDLFGINLNSIEEYGMAMMQKVNLLQVLYQIGK
jgi:asparagine synthetase B (glutamine-hydrolysing)